MAVIQMPARKGENEMGLITKWHKKTGDWVAEGDELFSFDTEEGTFTVKSQKAGRLVAVFAPEGEIVRCPADVGMLTTASPDSVLKLGRQQFIDETKPVEAREPAVQEPAMEEEEEAIVEEAEALEEADIAEEAAEFSEEELLEYMEDDLTEVEAMEETAEAELIEDEDEAAEAELVEDEDEAAEAEEAIISEEELLQYVEEDVAELELLDEAAEEADEEPAEELVEEAEAVEEAADAESEQAEACVEEPVVTVKPASVTAQADMSLCMDIAERTGVSVGAMVRFAAMHTQLAQWLEAVEAGGLRALDALEVLPNVRDLSATGVVAVSAVCDGGVELLVPAVHEAWRVNNDALEVYPCLNLTLAFDENVIALEEAAAGLKETCGKLENLIELLI